MKQWPVALHCTVFIMFVGCNDGSSEPNPSPTNDGSSDLNTSPPMYTEVTGGGGLEAPTSLCETIARRTGPAGMAEVTTIEGRTEIIDGVERGFTYARFQFNVRWDGGTLSTEEARFSGGPLSVGREGWQIRRLVVGETVGVMLLPQVPRANGTYSLDNLGLFRDDGSGFTNGQIFTTAQMTADALSLFMADWYSQNRCAAGQDVQPDLPGVVKIDVLGNILDAGIIETMQEILNP